MRVLTYHASRDLVPLYSVYALLFGDHGVSTGQISTLFIIWSLTSFVFEVPSGAWADTIDRRLLLVLSAVVYATAFSAWMLFPTYSGYAVGFVLWGLSSALMSGTFEAALYDELVDRGAEAAYPGIIGWAHSTAMMANLVATVAAAPLLAIGGYGLVGWTSVAIAGGQAVLAANLPFSLAARRPSGSHRLLAETEALTARYLSMLRAGIRESSRSVDVRRVVLIAALLVGLTAYDEYFPLVARDHGVATSTIPLLIGLAVIGQVVGTALAGRTAGMRSRTIGVVVVTGGGLISLGALVWPYVGFVAIAIGYGLLNNTMIVAEARLQQVIAGPARATVTSVYGLATEVVALAVYGTFAAAAGFATVPTLVALLGVPIVAIGWSAGRWFPGPTTMRAVEVA
ncbi:MAG: MFS transporter [Nocardioidaceae bacterium]